MSGQKLEIIVGEVKSVSEELARRTVEEIEVARRDSRKYILAVAKGSSAIDYYKSLGKNGKGFEDVVAFCIDEDFGTTNAHDFAKENMPRGTLIISPSADYGSVSALKTMVQEHPAEFVQRGREIICASRNAGSIAYAIAEGCTVYEQKMGLCNGIDQAVIGLGVEPMHMGSNFPQTYRDTPTHLAEKVDSKGNVTGYAITMGIATLCGARKAVLFATGEKKAEGVRLFFESPINENCPPAYLRNMDNLVVALDTASASKLDFGRLKEMYKDRELVIKA